MSYSIKIKDSRRLNSDYTLSIDDLTTDSFRRYREKTNIFKDIDFSNITIKSYYQRMVIQALFNLFGSILGNAVDNFKAGSVTAATVPAVNNALDKVKETTSTDKSFIDLCKKLATNIVAKVGNGLDDMVGTIPYILSRGLFTTESGGNINIPIISIGSSPLMMSDGSYGWKPATTWNPFSESGGSLVGTMLKTLGVTMIPIFSPGAGGGETLKLDLTFDLINDTADKAVKHENFVTQTVINNMWIQYGLTQGPGALYDIKIPGYMALYMCTGNFKVTPKGSWRQSAFGDKWIPDIYSVSMSFSSLLPNNYNSAMWEFDRASGTRAGSFNNIIDNMKK